MKQCPSCNGIGKVNCLAIGGWQNIDCPRCKGTGGIEPHPEAMKTPLLTRLRTHILHMAPHQKEREQGALLIEVERELAAALERMERMRRALPDVGKLRHLADWFDIYDAQTGNCDSEVQAELRRWAKEAEQALAKPLEVQG